MYGLIQQLGYPLVDRIPGGVLRRTMQAPDASWSGSSVWDQVASARVIERETKAAGLPPELTAAMLANAAAESMLDPKARGDWRRDLGRHTSIGLFQLHDAPGAGAGLTFAQREDPTTNVRRIIETLWETRGRPPIRGATPDYRHEHPLDAWDRGVRDIGHLADMFAIYVEGAAWARKPKPGVHPGNGHAGRMKWAHRMFPGQVSRGLPLVAGKGKLPRPGARLPKADTGSGRLAKGKAPPPVSDDWWFEAYLPEPMKAWFDPEEEPSSATATPAPRAAPAPSSGTGSWTATSSRFKLRANGKNYGPGNVPAGAYQLTWDNMPATQVRVIAGVSYRAWTKGRTVHFSRA